MTDKDKQCDPIHHYPWHGGVHVDRVLTSYSLLVLLCGHQSFICWSVFQWNGGKGISINGFNVMHEDYCLINLNFLYRSDDIRNHCTSPSNDWVFWNKKALILLKMAIPMKGTAYRRIGVCKGWGKSQGETPDPDFFMKRVSPSRTLEQGRIVRCVR